MELISISLEGFRNLTPQALGFDAKVHLLLGQNGQGKTNFLEALYTLCTLKSFRQAKRRDLIAWNHPQARLRAVVRRQGIDKEIVLTLTDTARTLTVNGHPVKDLLSYFREVKAVCFSPEDMSILHGSPRQRRRFLDRLVFQVRPQHLFFVQEYERVLKQRNALLKRWQKEGRAAPEELSIWTEQLLSQGARLAKSRVDFLRELNLLLPEQYARVCGLRRESGLLEGEMALRCRAEQGESYEDFCALYRSACEQVHVQESRRGTTLWGPHLEDFDLFYGEHLASAYASMGQQKTLLLAIRLAELELVTRSFGETPLLLIDDISAELDEERLRTLVTFLAQGFGVDYEQPQIFISTVAPTFELLKPLGALQVYTVEQGLMAMPPTRSSKLNVG